MLPTANRHTITHLKSLRSSQTAFNHMKTKTLLTHTYTKRCTYGNVYHAVQIENPRNGKSFTVHAPCLSNIENILNKAFGGWDKADIRSFSNCTGSARIASLPDETASYMNECKFTDDWKRELNNIGFRLPSKK